MKIARTDSGDGRSKPLTGQPEQRRGRPLRKRRDPSDRAGWSAAIAVVANLAFAALVVWSGSTTIGLVAASALAAISCVFVIAEIVFRIGRNDYDDYE